MPDVVRGAYAGPIIDAHHHVWDLQRNLHPWLTPAGAVAHRYGDYAAIKHDYLATDYLADIAGSGVVASVYMEAEWDPMDALGEVAYVRSVRAATGVPGAMAAQAWLDAPDAIETLDALRADPFVRSVRHKPGGPGSPAEVGSTHTLMRDDAWLAGYGALAARGLHFELQTPWWNLAEAATLADEHPDTLLVVNHAGVVLDRAPETLRGWRAAMESLAASSNVVVKASGLCVEGERWPETANQLVIDVLLDAFGADRVMFGSNFPVDGMFATYGELLSGYRSLVQEREPEQQRAFFHDTAARVYAPSPIADAG